MSEADVKLLVRAPEISQPLVFVDVETTGLAPSSPLLELAMVITDGDLQPRASFSVVLAANVHLTQVNPKVVEMHSKNGLWTDVVTKGVVSSEAEARARRFLSEFNATGAPMAGSSVHFDRRVLKNHMSNLEALFHYRNVDVSTIKELVRRWAPELEWKSGRGIHRALEDIWDTIYELKHYREVMGL